MLIFSNEEIYDYIVNQHVDLNEEIAAYYKKDNFLEYFIILPTETSLESIKEGKSTTLANILEDAVSFYNINTLKLKGKQK